MARDSSRKNYMDDPMSVDLRKIKKSVAFTPPPVIHVAPPPRAVIAPPPEPAVQKPPAEMSSMVPAATNPNPSRLPPRPKRGWNVPAVPSWTKMAVWGVGALLILLVGYYIYSAFWTRSPFGATPGASAETTETTPAASSVPIGELSEAEIIAKVSGLMLVPDGESPALAKVSDLSALNGQAFFAHAKVGDIVLMYAKASRAILYDPVANKIIEVGPIQNATSTVQTAQ